MAINKSNSPTWVKVTLIVLIVAFVMSFVVLASNPFGGGSAATDTAATTPAAGTADDTQFQGTVAALTSQLQSDPESYTVLVSLGNAYFDWAANKQQASQNSTSQAGADLPLWVAAKDAYARAVAIDGTESPVLIDYSITLFYTGDTAKAIEVAEGVVKSDPKFGPAPFNLGIFYQALGQNDKALASFQRFLEVDPTGATGGNVDYAKQQITALEAGGTTAQ